MKKFSLMLRREGQALYPADPVSDDYIAQIPMSSTIMATPWVPRNPRFNGLAHSYLKKVADNNELYTDIEALKNYLAIEMGDYTMFVGHDGKEIYRLRGSTDFASMDEVHFRRWMKRAQYLIGRDIMPNYTLDDHKRIYLEAQAALAQYQGNRE